MEYITWIGKHIELIIKSLISIVLLFPFIKTWKACEDEIKSVNNVLNNRYKVFLDNIKRANEYCNNFCNIDLSGITNDKILEAKIKSYNQSVKDYQDKNVNIIMEQDDKIVKNQEKLFELRKNEWKSIVPFLSVLALMWLGIKF